MIARISRVLCLAVAMVFTVSAATVVVPISGALIAGAQYSDGSLTSLTALDVVGAAASGVYDTSTSAFLGGVILGDPTFGGLFGTPTPPNVTIAAVTTSLSDFVAFVLDISAFPLYNTSPGTSLILPAFGLAVGSPDALLSGLLSGPAFAVFSAIDFPVGDDQKIYRLDYLVVDASGVPEPTTFVLIGAALPLILAVRRKF